jgi:hypothetical protein
LRITLGDLVRWLLFEPDTEKCNASTPGSAAAVYASAR